MPRMRILSASEQARIELPQEIAEGCNRLIKNSIICWNYLYLTRQLERVKTPEERDRLLQTIATHSPQSWGHFNFSENMISRMKSFRTTLAFYLPKS